MTESRSTTWLLIIVWGLCGLLMVGGVLKSLWSFHATGSMQESDIVVFVAGFMTAMLGLLAEVIVAHHRR